METRKKSFWRGFTWKRFFLFSIYLFAGTLLVGVILNYFDPEEKISDLFTANELLPRLITAVFMGLLFSILFERIEKKLND